MAQTSVRETRRWTRFAPGLALTVLFAVTAPLALGPFEPFESFAEDRLLWRLRPPVDASPDITLIEIDDAALERIQKWPWSWDKMAGIIDALSDLQARAVVLDVIYSERPEPELRKDSSLAEYPTGAPLFDIPAPPAGDATAAGAGPAPAKPAPIGVEVDPLPILAHAIRRSDRTILTYAMSARTLVSDPLYQQIERILADQPTLAADQVARQLGRPIEEVSRFYLTARRRALEIALSRSTPVDPANGPAVKTAFAALFPGQTADTAGSLAPDFREAVKYSWQEARLAARGALDQPVDATFDPVPRAGRATAPVVELADAAAGLGFANVFPDSDGVVRRVPLAIVLGHRLFPQLGLKAAMFAQGARSFTLRRDGRTMIVTGDNRLQLRVPVDEKGQMIINWSKGRDGRQDGFRHLPIGKVYQYWTLLTSRRTYEASMAFAAGLFKAADQRALLAAKVAEARRAPVPKSDLEPLVAKLDELDGRLATDLLKMDFDGRPKDMDLRQYQQVQAYAKFLQDYSLDVERIDRQLAEVADQLRDAIQGRLCFIGMTATSAALDLKPTPIHRQYPGVFAHAAIADNLLRRDFVRSASPVVRVGLLLLLGLSVTLVAGWLPTLRATLASLLLMLAYWGLCWLLLTYRGSMVLLAWPVLTGALSLLAIMVYRELTEGRMRRWITGAFKQYNSPEMVDQILANPEALALGGQRRDMTVYFSDIAGFTSLAERLTAPQLVGFLQAYLGQMTDLLYQQGGTLDKYIGDAVVAFFNAPLVQPDHAARCLRAALAHLRALPVLNQRLHAQGFLPDNHQLRIRIGISTGPMNVGNFGSEHRFSYTVIDNTVNIGARLEGANRAFDTTVLVAAATQAQVGDEFLLRRIGPVRFLGKNEAIDVYELLDPEAPAARAGLDDYHAALKEFDSGWYHEARLKFESALAARPGDGPTLAYLKRTDALLRDGVTAPPGPWDMTEK